MHVSPWGKVKMDDIKLIPQVYIIVSAILDEMASTK